MDQKKRSEKVESSSTTDSSKGSEKVSTRSSAAKDLKKTSFYCKFCQGREVHPWGDCPAKMKTKFIYVSRNYSQRGAKKQPRDRKRESIESRESKSELLSDLEKMEDRLDQKLDKLEYAQENLKRLSQSEENESDLEEVVLMQTNYNEFCVNANIDGVQVFCQLSTSTTCNLLQEDVWHAISSRGVSSYTLDVTRSRKIRNFDSFIYPLGRVRLPVMINGAEYKLDWVVVPRDTIPVKACLGTPLFEFSVMSYGPNGPIIKPTVKPKAGINQVLLEEFEKIKYEINRRMHLFVTEQNHYLEEQTKNILKLVENLKTV